MHRVRNLLHANECYYQGVYGQKVTVAVLDTGIYRHVGLVHHIKAFYDAVHGAKIPYDDNGHGTHVSGIICDSYYGLAPKAEIVAVKVLDREGKGDMNSVLKGISWITDFYKRYQIRIVNISFGASDETEEELKRLSDAVGLLWDKGMIVVASAGNNGPQRSTVTMPGANRKVITVGAMDDQHSTNTTENYSGRGPTRECILKPEIVTYGSDIYSCKSAENGYVKKSGTSMATAIVSGTAALAISYDRNLTNNDFKRNLKKTALPTGLHRYQQGWGALDLPAVVMQKDKTL